MKELILHLMTVAISVAICLVAWFISDRARILDYFRDQHGEFVLLFAAVAVFLILPFVNIAVSITLLCAAVGSVIWKWLYNHE